MRYSKQSSFLNLQSGLPTRCGRLGHGWLRRIRYSHMPGGSAVADIYPSHAASFQILTHPLSESECLLEGVNVCVCEV